MAQWLPTIEIALRPSTFDSYKSNLTNYVVLSIVRQVWRKSLDQRSRTKKPILWKRESRR